MKNKIVILIFLGILMFIPIKTNAASVNVTFNCPSTANSKDIISCQVNVSGDIPITGLKAKYNITGATWESFAPANGFVVSDSNNIGFLVQNISNDKSNVTIGTIKFKITSASTITLKEITASDDADNLYTIANKTASIRLKSTINTLSSLTLSNGVISPTFDSNTTNYTATVNDSSTFISATLTDAKAKLTGTGTQKINYGSNKINIVVTSESGSSKTYTITITRPDNRSTNNNLKTLTTNQGNISFSKNLTTYNINVNYNVSSITLNATLEDAKASFVKGYGPRTVNLNYGSNYIQIRVQAENTSVKTYVINVNRQDNRSSNNYLKQLTLSNGQIVFNKDVLEYNTTVQYDVTKINVVAVPEDNKSKVVVNSPNLNVGNNVIVINVTSENAKTRTYKIIVKRLTAAEKMSDNNNINSLRVLGHNFNFDANTLEYNLNIKDEYALVFEINLEDPKAKYKIEGNEALKDGSIIKVISTSESGQTKEYKFNISKKIEKGQEQTSQEENKSNDNNIMYIAFGLGGFVLGVIITLIIKKKK